MHHPYQKNELILMVHLIFLYQISFACSKKYCSASAFHKPSCASTNSFKCFSNSLFSPKADTSVTGNSLPEYTIFLPPGIFGRFKIDSQTWFNPIICVAIFATLTVLFSIRAMASFISCVLLPLVPTKCVAL